MEAVKQTPMEVVKQTPIQKTVTVLTDTGAEEQLIQKPWEFTPVRDANEALARVANDSARFLKIVNDGLRAEVASQLRNDPEGWHSTTDEGEINGPFMGSVAHPKVFNSMVLTMAKHVFGYSKDMTPEQKKAAKEQSTQYILSQKVVLDGIKKSSAAEFEREAREA